MKENNSILDGAGPFYYNGNEVGVLMIHGGGGGTCADLKPLAEDLHEKKGYTISVPLLPGFGTKPEILRDTKIEDWKQAIIKELRNLKKNCKTIIIGGHSMGAILSLIMASEYEFNGVFTIGAPIGINNPFLKILPIINLFKKYYKTEAKQLKKDTNGKWVGYEKIPINVGIKIKTLLKEMEKSLSKISCPIILFQGKNDSVIKKTSMNEIFEKISSKEKYKIWLENSDHPILCISDHEKIVSELIAFIEGL